METALLVAAVAMMAAALGVLLLVRRDVSAVRVEGEARVAELVQSVRNVMDESADKVEQRTKEALSSSAKEIEARTTEIVRPRLDLSVMFEQPLADTVQAGDLVVIPTGDPGEVLVVGSETKARTLGTITGAMPTALARTIVGGNALAQMAISAGEQAGVLVRITAESAQKMKELSTIPAAGGSFLGVLRDGSGHFAHVVQFSSASGLQSLANVTGALSGVALQMELASLEKAIGEVAEQVSEVRRELERAREADELATREIILEAYRVAMATGELTEFQWSQIAPLHQKVRRVQHRARLDIEAAYEAAGAKGKLGSFISGQNEGSLEQQFLDLFDAQQLVGQYQSLRLWRAIETGDPGLTAYQREIEGLLQEQAEMSAKLLELAQGTLDSAARKALGWTAIFNPVGRKRLLDAVEKNEKILRSIEFGAERRAHALDGPRPELLS